MNNKLTNEQIDLIKSNEWLIFSTSSLNNQPHAIIVLPSRVEENRIILSNVQMNVSIDNIKNNNKCFLNSYCKDKTDTQIKIEGRATVYDEGNLYNEIKNYEEKNNLPEDLKVHSIIVIEYDKIEITQE